jgi:DNA replication protein DnaD
MKLEVRMGPSSSSVNRQTRAIEENARRQETQMREQARMSQLQLEQSIAREAQNRRIQEMERQRLNQTVEVDQAPEDVVRNAIGRRLRRRDTFRATERSSGLNV